MIDMSGAFNRIRFCGPEVATVLKEVLHATPLELIENCDDKWLSWFNRQSDMNGKKYVNAQALLWEAVDNMEDFPSQAILPLVVRDPRVFLPQKRTKVLLNNEASDAEEEEMEVDGQEAKPTEEAFLNSSELFAEFLSQAINPLEDSAVPGMLLKEKMTDEEFCKRRAGLLIPGRLTWIFFRTFRLFPPIVMYIFYMQDLRLSSDRMKIKSQLYSYTGQRLQMRDISAMVALTCSFHLGG